MLNAFLLFANTFLRLLLFLAALIPQLLQKSRFPKRERLLGSLKMPRIYNLLIL